MPEIVCRKSPGKSYTFKLYTPAEIKRSWRTYDRHHLQNVKDGRNYIIIDVKDEEDALILAALIIRKANINCQCVHYAEELGKVLVNCEYVGVNFEEVKKHCRFITKIYLGLPNLSGIKFDLKGDPLLRNPDQDIEEFYQGRNFPAGSYSPTISHMPAHRIHEYMSPDTMGII